MKYIESGAALWSKLNKSAGLDLKRYDSELESSFRKTLKLKEKGSAYTQLREQKIGPEPVLGAFFDSLQPFSLIYKDILKLVEAIGMKQGEDNLLIRFDFDKARSFNIDLQNFRQQVTQFQKVVRSIVEDTWTYERFWAIWRAFGEHKNEYPNERIRLWAEQYDKEGIWPEDNLEPPVFNDNILDSYVNRVWQVRQASIDAARSISSYRNDLGTAQGATREVTLRNWHIEITPGVREFLAWLHSDHWTVSLANKIYWRKEEAAKNHKVTEDLIEKLRPVLDNPPLQQRNVTDAIQEILDLLALPIWKHRYELYSIWVLTQIVDALGGANGFQFRLSGNVFHIPFSSKWIATLNDSEPEMRLWSEVRYPISRAIGKGRKRGMQPDYSLTINTCEPPIESFALVECKQYLKASIRNFRSALFDYSTGQPNASVLLVNYGPAGTQIKESIPEDLEPRTKIIGQLRPLIKESKTDFDLWLQDQLVRNTRRRFSPQAVPLNDSSLQEIPNEQGRIELRWKDHPSDLDLYIFVVGENKAVVGYSNAGKPDAYPWMQLHSDIRAGHGPEIISVFKVLNGIYRVAVYLYSDDGQLAACGATVSVNFNEKHNRTFVCPTEGKGRWWHVCDMDPLNLHIIEINSIVVELSKY